MKNIIFLDFDGVLHTHSGKRFHRADFFAQIVSKLDNVDIVFSTSWREYSTVDKLSSYLPKSIQAKCIGMTPILKDTYTHVRFKEIMMYTNQFNISDDNWVAIDDMACLFPKDCPNLILIDSKHGFSKADAKKLNLKLNITP